VTAMTAPSTEQVRHFAVDLVAATITELLLARLARRLREGPAHRGHRYIRRAAGAVISELVAEGVADLYWQRRRLRAEVDRRIVAARIEARHAKRHQIPTPRSVPATERLAAELAPVGDGLTVG
jgi:hypothetical protein